MGALYSLNFINFLLKFTFYFLVCSVLFSTILWYFSAIYNSQTLVGNYSPLVFIKFVLIVSMVVIAFSTLMLTIFYSFYQKQLSVYVLYIPLITAVDFFDQLRIVVGSSIELHFSLDGFGLVLLNLALLVGLISLLTLDTRHY
jgi:hypothetical protein